MQVETRSVDQRTTQHRASRSRAEEFMKRRRRNNIIIALVAICVVAFLIFNIASCAFKSFASATMALNNEDVKKELVVAKENEPYYILLAGLSNYDQSSEAASYLAVLRIDEQNKSFSLMNIPSNIMCTYDQGTQDLLRNAPRYGGEAELVRKAKEQTGIDFAHYLRITEEGLKTLVDDIGGVQVNVEYRLDDPRVGHVVIPPGEQTLNGEQAVAFVSATNYQGGRTQRTANQMEFFFDLINKMTSSEGIGWINDSDVISNAIKTDLSYDTLSALAAMYGQGASFYTALMPGSQYTVNNVICFSPNSKAWEQMRGRFMNGEDVNTSIDTSGIDKSKLSIVVYNGTGSDGFAAQAAQILQSKGYTVQETGNADSAVYTETLVIYRTQKTKRPLRRSLPISGSVVRCMRASTITSRPISRSWWEAIGSRSGSVRSDRIPHFATLANYELGTRAHACAFGWTRRSSEAASFHSCGRNERQRIDVRVSRFSARAGGVSGRAFHEPGSLFVRRARSCEWAAYRL